MDNDVAYLDESAAAGRQGTLQGKNKPDLEAFGRLAYWRGMPKCPELSRGVIRNG